MTRRSTLETRVTELEDESDDEKDAVEQWRAFLRGNRPPGRQRETMSKRDLSRRISELEDDTGVGDEYTITWVDETVVTPWEPEHGDAPEPGVTVTRIHWDAWGEWSVESNETGGGSV